MKLISIRGGKFFFLVAILLVTSCSVAPQKKTCGITNHELVLDNGASLLWSDEQFFVFDEPHIALAQATPDFFFLQAVDAKSSKPKMYVYQTLTGKLIWEKKINTYSIFVANDQVMTESTHNGIVRYDSRTGTIIEKVNFLDAVNVLYMYDYQGKIFVYDSGGKYYIYDQQNNEVTKLDTNLTRTSFIQEHNVKYVNDPDGFKAIDINTNNPLWKIKFSGGISRGPLFDNEMIFVLVNNDTSISNLYALDKNSGAILWESKLGIISNIDASETSVYFLTIDGYLIALDKESGNVTLSLELSSQPFLLPYNAPDENIGAYTVSIDSVNNVVILTIGDSCQLFALQTH